MTAKQFSDGNLFVSISRFLFKWNKPTMPFNDVTIVPLIQQTTFFLCAISTDNFAGVEKGLFSAKIGDGISLFYLQSTNGQIVVFRHAFEDCRPVSSIDCLP